LSSSGDPAAVRRQLRRGCRRSGACMRRPPSDQSRAAQISPVDQVKRLILVNQASFAKEPLGFSLITSQSFHLQIPLQSSPLLYVLAPIFIRFSTRGPAKPFYDLNLLFLNVISSRPLVSCWSLESLVLRRLVPEPCL
jgi:hypothetical protein